MLKDKIAGSMIGSAIGDAFGYTTEFMKLPEIIAKYGEKGLQEPIGSPLKVTDDTQMGLAVAKALIDSYQLDTNISPQIFEEELRKTFIAWLNDPENNRAPGMTCLKSCENLAKGMFWEEATAKNAKGCGANMRVVPVALFKFKDTTITDNQIAQLAQFQAALTHAHPTALVASELTAITIVKLIEGILPENLVESLLNYCKTQQNRKDKYHAKYLGEVWQRPFVNIAEDFIEKGWQECIKIVEKVADALKKDDKTTDPCLYTGEGWIAEEAFGTALLCFLYFPDDAKAVLRRAVNTTGDSDSIACLAGAFVGAYKGLGAFPKDWVARIEYKDDLERFINFIIENK